MKRFQLKDKNGVVYYDSGEPTTARALAILKQLVEQIENETSTVECFCVTALDKFVPDRHYLLTFEVMS